jgi:hypothetical protein
MVEVVKSSFFGGKIGKSSTKPCEHEAAWVFTGGKHTVDTALGHTTRHVNSSSKDTYVQKQILSQENSHSS